MYIGRLVGWLVGSWSHEYASTYFHAIFDFSVISFVLHIILLLLLLLLFIIISAINNWDEREKRQTVCSILCSTRSIKFHCFGICFFFFAAAAAAATAAHINTLFKMEIVKHKRLATENTKQTSNAWNQLFVLRVAICACELL